MGHRARDELWVGVFVSLCVCVSVCTGVCVCVCVCVVCVCLNDHSIPLAFTPVLCRVQNAAAEKGEAVDEEFRRLLFLKAFELSSPVAARNGLAVPPSLLGARAATAGLSGLSSLLSLCVWFDASQAHARSSLARAVNVWANVLCALRGDMRGAGQALNGRGRDPNCVRLRSGGAER